MSKGPDEVRASVLQRFTNTAIAPQDERKFSLGPESARQLGYAAAEIDALPTGATESFCGVGNPLGLGVLEKGATVVDVGCGAGMDSLLAGHRVGTTGRVIGVDMTEAMIDKARQNGRLLGADNVAFVQSEIDALPLPDGSAHVVISNGAFNLCVDKPKVLGEIHRVLRPGGHLQMADILLHDEVTPAEVASKGTWSD